MKKNDSAFWEIYTVILGIVMCITFINQGGFFEGAIVFAGLIMSTFAFGKKFIVKIGLSDGLFFAFALWYFICSLKNGFITDYAAGALMPFVVFVCMIYINNAGALKEKVLEYVVKISLAAAFAAIARTAVLSMETGSLERLLFPFNYSNAAGIYYAVCYFLCDRFEDKWLKWGKYVFIIALCMSQSVGAVALFVAAQGYVFISEKKFKQLGVMVAAVLALGLALSGRVIESTATFLERLLQIHDGIRCIIDNPIWGIGAGSWECAKQAYQTGFYSATELHSSIVTVGVSSGIAGLVLFVTAVVLKLKNNRCDKKALLPVLMLLIHSAVDFTLSFSFICFFVALITHGNEKKIELNKCVKYIAVSAAFSVMLFSAVGQYYVANPGDFVNNFFAIHNVRTCRDFADFAIKNQIYNIDEGVFNNLGHMPTEVIIYKYYLKGGGEYLIQALKEQPYNSVLRAFIEENCSEEYKILADEVYEAAIEAMSPLGKKLYELKGENL